MPRTRAEKGKSKEEPTASKEETFSQLLMGGEEEFDGYLKENETLEEEEDEEPASNLSRAQDDDDKDSLEDWMPQDEEIIDDNEITELLNNSASQRTKLKTGGQDELERDMEEFENNLALTSGIGIKNLSKSARKRALVGEVRLSDEVKRKLGEANGLYIARDYGAAIDILQSIIKENPKAHPAWNTLGLVHQELQNKERSLQLRMVAAHMCNDTSLWKELGQKSIENDATTQAIYCFSKALTLDPSDVDALWDRSFLHKQLGRSMDAIAGFTKILELMPHHFKVINELAQLYRVQGKTKEAIQMYEDAIAYHNDNMNDDEDEDNEDEEDEFSDKLGYSEINMLSELYLILNDYRKSLDTIKTGLRHVQKRQNETWWIDRDDDDEYLEEDEARTDFPIELRVRMGVCRVYLNQVRGATRHFQYLLQYPATTYPDLHQDIAYAYYDKRHYDLALSVFQRIIDASFEIEVDLLIRTADCYREVGDLDTAVVFYINVLDEQPDNLDVMMSLATVYEEQGKEEEALELVDFVMKKNRELRKLKKLDATKGDDDDLTPEEKLKRAKEARKAKFKKASIFDENTNQSKADFLRQKQEDKLRQNEEKDYLVKNLFEKLDELDKQIGKNLVKADRSLVRDYMRSAQELWELFWAVRGFWPSSRSKPFEGFYALRKGRKNANKQSEGDVNLEAHHMANRLRNRIKTENGMEVDANDLDDEEKMIIEQEEKDNRIATDSHLRGFSFDLWVSVFLKYAYMLTLTKRVAEAYEMLKQLASANVNYTNTPRKTAIKLATIGCGMIDDNESITQEGMRWFCNFYQFRNDPFRLYTAVISCGGKSTEAYASSSQMKYLARNIRLLDAIIASTRAREKGKTSNQPELKEIQELNDAILAMNVDPSTASEQNFSRYYDVPEYIQAAEIEKMGIVAPTHANPIMLSLFGHTTNVTRNHIAASLFFLRAYAIAPKDRLNTLSLGIALLHAAMQRKTDNRHLQIMQGMMFVMEYVTLTGYCQESEYNLARAFHMIGLTHLAVPHYEKVLCLPSTAMKGIVEEKPVEEVYSWPVEDDFDDDEEEDFTDLKREAAYNLHMIYATSGSMSLAQILLLKYCSI